MAWNNPLVTRPTGVQSALNLGGAGRAIDEGVARTNDVIGEGAVRRMAVAEQVIPRRRDMPDEMPGEFAINDATGEVMLPDGTVTKMNAPTMVRLATLRQKDGSALPKIDPSVVPAGFRMYHQSQLAADIDAIDEDSDFWGELGSSLKTGIGLAGSTIDSLIGNDDPSNSWSRAGRTYSENQTIGQFKASNSPWFSDWDSFMSGLGQTAGNIGSGLAVAAPALIAGGAVGSAAGPEGTIGGAIGGFGMAVSGGTQAYGEQATDFYDTAMEAMSKMDPEQLAAESPMYQQVVAERPGITHEEAMREVAIRGARAAGAAGALPGAIEGVIGGRLGGNVLAKLGFRTILAGKATQAATKTLTRRGAGFTARALLGGTGAGVSEMAETGLGQAAGANVTGIGDPTIAGNLNIEEGVKASQAGFLLGGFGGRAHSSALSDIGAAMEANAGRQSPNDEVPAQQGALALPGPTGMQPRPESRAWTGQRASAAPAEDVIDGEFTDVTNQPALAGPPAQRQLPAPEPEAPSVVAAREQQARQQQALQTFVQVTGLQTPEDVQAAMPELLDLADENPGFAQIMQDAGIMPTLMDQAPDMAAASQAQQDFATAPVPPGSAPVAPRIGNGPATAQQIAPQQVESPEPIAAPTERTPDGRPVGVAPAPLVNPEPMDPEQARQAAQTRRQRRRAAGAPASTVDPAEAASAAPAPVGEGVIELPLDEMRTRRGTIGSQGASEEGVRSILTGVLGLKLRAKASMGEMISKLKANPEAIAKLRAFMEQNPLKGTQLPDGTISVDDGHHRAFLLDQLGETTIPAVIEDYAGNAEAATTRAPAAPVTPDGVTESTPEPAGDIAAQVEAMLAPDTDRLAVFVAEGNEAQIPTDLPPDVLVVSRKGRGTLLTVNPQVANKFKRGKWTDEDNARVLGYSENKTGENAGAGVVVQARNPEGNIEAQQLATNTPRNRKAAEVAVKRQARRGAKVETTTPEAAQQERAARATEPAPKAAALKERLRAKRAADEAKKKVPAQVEDEVDAPRRGRKADEGDTTQSEKAARTATARGTSEAAPRVDVAPMGRQKRERVKIGDKDLELSDSLVVESGIDGGAVDLRVQSVNEEERLSLRSALMPRGDGTVALSARDLRTVESRLLAMQQLDTALDAAVDAAEERLLNRLEADPEGKSLLSAAKAAQARQDLERRQRERAAAGKSPAGRPGRPSESPLIYVPLSSEEMLHFGRLARRQAKAEAAIAQDPSKSVARRLLKHLLPQGWDRVLDSAELLQDALKSFAELSDEALDTLVRSAHHALRDSVLAKQVMRGATEVARAYTESQDKIATRVKKADTEAEAASEATDEMPSVGTPDIESLGLKENKGRRVTSFEGDLPEGTAEVLEGWIDTLERGGIKVDGDIRLMSMDAARALYPEAFPSSTPGRYATFLVDGEQVHVIAVDWEAMGDTYGVEVLAHEFGEFVGRHVFNRSDRETQEAVMGSYNAWLQAHGHLSPVEIFRSRAPQLLRTLAGANPIDAEYATSFSEWLADNVARYMLNRPEPKSLVQKFFARVGDMVRKAWESVVRTDAPDVAVAEMLDAWVAGRRAAAAGPSRIDSWAGNMEGVGEPGAEPEQGAGRRTAEAVVNRATKGLEDAKEVMGDAVRAVFNRDTDTLNEMGDGIYRRIMDSKAGAFFRRAGLSIMTLDQIERRFRNTPLGDSLSSWVRLQKQKAQLANVALNGGEFTLPGGAKVKLVGAADVLERANQLSTKARDLLTDIMYYSTHYGVHPDQAFEKQAHLFEGVDAAVVASNRRRYHQVRAMWDQMGAVDPATHEIYAGLRDAFKDLHEQTLDRQVENIKASQFSDKAKDEAIRKIKEYRRTLKNGPYFPLMRFGDWVVSVMQPAGTTFHESRAKAEEERRKQKALNPGARIEVRKGDDEWEVRVFRRGVYFFDSVAEAKAARESIEKELREQFDNANVDLDEVRAAIEGGTLNDEDGKETLISEPKEKLSVYEAYAKNSDFLTELRAEAAANGVRIDPELAQIMENIYIESLPEFSARKSMLPRQNVLGASKDMLRSYAMRFQGAAHAYSGVAFGGDIDKAWRAMEEVRSKSGFAPTGAVMNNLAASQQAIADRMKNSFGNRVSNMITDASSLFSLAFSPAYILTNAMQPWMISLPTLAGLTWNSKGNSRTLGAARATAYIKDAYEGAVPFFTKRGLADFIDESKRLFGQQSDETGLHKSVQAMIAKFGKSKEEQDMLLSMLESGRLDFSFLNSIEDAMRGGTVASKFGTVARLGMAFPSQVEAMNRVVTALASYRIARQEMGMADAEATAFASDMVGDTQLDYSRLNRPLLFNKPGFNIILQFKLYLQGMYALFVRNAYLAVKGGTAAEKKQGRATLMYLLGTHGAIGGATGLGPLVMLPKLAIGLAAMMMGRDNDDDEWKSPEQIFSEKAKFVFGDTGGQVAERGLPALLGLDIADRIGIPKFADEKFAGVTPRDDAGSALDKWTLYFLGAPYSNARRVLRGAEAAVDDDPYTHWTQGLPAGVRSITNAMRVDREGIVDRDGDTFLAPDALNWRDTAFSALGFQSATVARGYRERSEEKGTMARISESRKMLLKRWRTADADTRKDLRTEIREFNDKAPRPFRITADSLSQSVAAKKQRDAGVVGRNEQAVRDYLQ